MSFEFTFLLALTIVFLIASVIAIIWMCKENPLLKNNTKTWRNNDEVY